MANEALFRIFAIAANYLIIGVGILFDLRRP